VLLAASATLTGTVRTAGRPHAGATVSLMQAGELVEQHTTGADGRFAFTDLPADDYDLTVRVGPRPARRAVLRLAEGAAQRHDVDLGENR